MRRRRLLAALGSAFVGVTAGCNRSGQPTTDVDTAVTAEPTPTATAAPTATPTPTPTVSTTRPTTATPTDASTHALGEQFVVPGKPSFAYTFHGFRWADSLGPFDLKPDQEVFVVADATVENRGGEPDGVPTEDIVLRGNVRLYARTDDTDAAARDDRVTHGKALTDTVAFPGKPVRGVLAFDGPRDPDNRYYLRITPPGPPEDPVHHVPVGTLSEMAPLE